MATAPRGTSRTSPRRVDVGIITILETELEAVLAYLPPHDTATGRRQYLLCSLETREGDSYEIAVVRSLEPGTNAALDLARDILEELTPSWLFVVGIAAGVAGVVQLGDVVVSSRIADFTKLRPTDTLYTVSGGPIAREAANVVANLPALRQAMSGWGNLQVIRPQGPTDVPRATAGTIATSDRVIRDDRFLFTWQQYERDIKAIEMESAGVYRIASMRSVPFIAVRGIAELIGARGKGDDWRRYACHAAASFTTAFLRTRPFAPRRETSGAPGTPSTSMMARDHGPFYLQALDLTNVRGFEALEIWFPTGSSASDVAHPARSDGESEVGQWTMLIGPNGVGKTSILRALALALSTDEVVQALLGRLGTGAPMIRIGAAQAIIRITTSGGALPRIELRSGETGDRLDERGSGDVALPFVVAYGCRRGSVLGGPSRDVNVESPLSAVETLFDDHAGLVHAETWLKERKLAATLTPDSDDEAFFNAVVQTLTDGLLPGVHEIHVSDRVVEVAGPEVGRIPLGAISDGYITTAGWVIDLIARWSEDARRRGVALDASFREQMTGLAIIDEIDLHLHPRWQRDVVKTIRRLFPRMSFVVTTHNPLTLLGAQPGEVFVLHRDETSGRIEARQRDLPPGLGTEGVLTGDWFGLPSTLDDDTLDLLARHRELLRVGSANNVEARQLEQTLTDRLGSYAATSVERMAQSAAAQVLDEDVRKLSPKDRKAAHDKIAELLRDPPRARHPRAATRKKRAER